MTYDEAVERNMRNEAYADLIPYMELIVHEHFELDLDTEGELIDSAAEQMMMAELDGEPISTTQAIALARKEIEERPQREAELKEINKHMAEIMELRGIEPLINEDLLNMILNAPEDEPKDTTPKLEASYARKSIRQLAESMRNEPCLFDVHYFQDGGLWQAILRFTDGELSVHAQEALIQMKHNAHRMMLNQNKNMKAVTFIVADNEKT